MKHALALAAALIGSAGFAAIPALAQSLGLSGSTSQPSGMPAEFHPDPNHGRFVALGGQFGQLRVACSSCHQLDGTGDRSGVVPRLTDQGGWYLYGTLHDFADGARTSAVMTPIARELTDRDMQDVAAYYATLPPQPYPPNPMKDKAAIESGKAIAAHGMPGNGVPACASCHGAQGIGNPPLYPYLAGQYEPYLELQLKRFKAGERQGDPMAVMEAIASNLSDKQIHAVAAYFASLSPKQVAPQPLLAQASERREAQRQPLPAEQRPHMGVAKNPKPGKGNVVVPGTTGQQ